MSLRTRRIDYLDGIRAMAILSVVAVHWLPQYMPTWLPILKGGYIGVDLFLILSGYLISRILWRSPAAPIRVAYGSFLKRRFWRLYPALLGMLVVVTLLVWLVGNPTDGTTATWRAVVSATQLSPIVSVLQLDSMLPFEHTWTLGWEWYFYLVWPLVLLALRKRGVSVLKVAAGSGVLALLLYAISVTALSTPVMYNGPLARFSELLLGSSLGLYFLARPEPLALHARVRTALMGASVIAIAIWTIVGPHHHDRLYGVLGFPLIAASGLVLIAIGYGRESDAVPRLLAWSPIKKIGLWSYSIYLWHLPPLLLIPGDFVGLPRPVLAVLGVAVTALLVWSSYRFLEKPFLKSREAARPGAPLPIQESTPAS
jgi:peptidoglycan/LPS O-acetylase OafA/YrhL